MDRNDLEPGYRMHEDQPRMQALLRREDVETAPKHGYAQIPERVLFNNA